MIQLALAKLLVGPLFDWLKSRDANQITREELQLRLEEHLASESVQIVLAEIKGEDWLQRNWRPVVALVSFFSCWFVIFPYGFFVAWGLLPQIRFGEIGLQHFFTLTTICLGGYIGARTIEKVWKK